MKKNAFFLLSFSCIILILFSCKKKEYNLDNGVDMTVNVGGDSLMLPIGSTDTMYLKALLKDIDMSFLNIDEDGAYVLQIEDSIDVDVPVFSKEDLRVDDVVVSVTEILTLSLVPSGIGVDEFAIAGVDVNSNANNIAVSLSETSISGAELDKISVDIVDSIPLNFAFGNIPAEIKRVDSLIVENTVFTIKFSISNMPEIGEGEVFLDLDVRFPNDITFQDAKVDENNVWHITAPLTNSAFEAPLKIRRINSDGNEIENGSLSINDKLILDGVLEVRNPSVDPNDLNGAVISLNIDLGIRNIVPSEFYGEINPNLPEQNISLELDDIPSFLKGENIILDFDRPYILTTASANVGFSIDGHIQIVPFLDGSANNSVAQNIELILPKSADGNLITSTFWIANTTKDMLDGATFVQANIPLLLRRIPDSVQFLMNVTTLPNEQHFFDLNETYLADLDYKICVPLSFGPDTYIEFVDTISNIPDMLNSILKGGEITLYGDVLNSLPLDLNLIIVALDSLNNEIAIQSTEQLIKAADKDANAVRSDLNIVLSDKDAALENVTIKSLIIHFSANTGTEAAGQPIKETSFIQANLKARLIGGITVDLGK